MNFIWFLLIRISGALATVFVGSFLIFMIMQMTPGDPALAVLGEQATDEAVARYRAEHGLDEPVLVQFAIWAGNALQGNLGNSIVLAGNFPILQLLEDRLPITVFIGVYGLILALVMSLTFGTIAALRHGKLADTAATSVAVLGISMPDFWLSYVLIFAFALTFTWFPSYGFANPYEDFFGALHSGFLPAFAIAAPMAGVFTRILRAALLETAKRDYVTAARSYGFAAPFVFIHYVFRNAIIPFVTVVGLQVRYLLGGVVIIERVFGISGMGSLVVDAAFGRDYPVVQACALTFLTVVLTVNLIVDIACALLDPKRTR
ncbi:MAG: ABC transporter permease [Alphaproteobacteria bacterium]|nr:ABC transporter permease [Alphaproteobacteria bacterium]